MRARQVPLHPLRPLNWKAGDSLAQRRHPVHATRRAGSQVLDLVSVLDGSYP